MTHSGNTLSYSQVVSLVPQPTKGPNATATLALTPTPLELSPRFSTTLPSPTTGPSGPSVSPSEVPPTHDVGGGVTEGQETPLSQQERRPKGTRGKGRPPWRNLPKPEGGEANEGSAQKAEAAASHAVAQHLSATSPVCSPSQQTGWGMSYNETGHPGVGHDLPHTVTSPGPSSISPAVTTSTKTPPLEALHDMNATLPTDAPAQVGLEGGARGKDKYQPHVLVLIDGDQCIPNIKFFLDTEKGGTNAATALNNFVKAQFPGRHDLRVSVELAWNQEGLRRTLGRNGYRVNSSQMREFVHEFQVDSLWSVSDRGRYKEGADMRLRGLLQLHLRLPHTEHIFLAYSEDGGYRTGLRGVLDGELQKKVSIIKGYKNSNPRLPFSCDVHEIPGLFMEERISNRWSAFTRSSKTSSPQLPNSAKTRTLSATSALTTITPPPSPADLSKDWRSSSDAPQGASQETSTPSSFSTSRSLSSLQTTSTVPATPHPQHGPGLSPVLSPAGFPGKLLEEVEIQPTSTAISHEEGNNGVGDSEPPVSLTAVLLEHTSICPSVDPSNLAFTPSSCSGPPLCRYRHQCPYGAECVLREASLCNFV